MYLNDGEYNLEAAHRLVEEVQPAVVAHQGIAHVEVVVTEHQTGGFIEGRPRVATVALQGDVQAFINADVV